MKQGSTGDQEVKLNDIYCNEIAFGFTINQRGKLSKQIVSAKLKELNRKTEQWFNLSPQNNWITWIGAIILYHNTL